MPNVRGKKLEVARNEPHEHALFPVDDEAEEIPQIDFVQVCRWEKGKLYYGPTFPAAEIQSQQDLFDRYGGGEYEIWGRRHAKSDPNRPGGRTKMVRFNVPGRSRPMSDDPAPSDAGAPTSTPPIVADNTALGGARGVNDLMMLMISQSQQAAQVAQQQAAESAKQFQTLMIQVLGNSKAEASSTMQTMIAMSQTNTQTMMQLMTAILGTKSGGGVDELGKFAALMKSLGMTANGAKAKDDAPRDNESIGSIIENLADTVTGMVALKGGAVAPRIADNTAEVPAGGAMDFLQRQQQQRG